MPDQPDQPDQPVAAAEPEAPRKRRTPAPAAIAEELAAANARLDDLEAALERVVSRTVTATDPDGALVMALADAQAAFPTIHKSKTADVVKNGTKLYSYNYADLADVLAAVRPVLGERGLAIVQRTVREPSGLVLLTELRHAGGGRIVSEVELGRGTGDAQAFGSSLTYLRRYELVTLLGVQADDDRDAQDVPPVGDRPPAAAAPAPELPAFLAPASLEAVQHLFEDLSLLLGQENAESLLRGVEQTTGGGFPSILVRFGRGIVARHVAMTTASQPDPAAGPDTPPEPAEAPQAPANGASGDAPPEQPPSGSVEPPDVSNLSTPAAKIARLRDAGCMCPSPLEVEAERTGTAPAPPEAYAAECPLAGHGIPL